MGREEHLEQERDDEKRTKRTEMRNISEKTYSVWRVAPSMRRAACDAQREAQIAMCLAHGLRRRE